MVIKIVLACATDLIVAQIPATVICIFYQINHYFVLSFAICLFTTTLSLLITKRHTTGEILLKICCVVSGKESMLKLLLRNFLFCFFIYLPFVVYSSFFDLLFMLSISFLVLFPNFKQEQNGLDIIFKSHFIGVKQ